MLVGTGVAEKLYVGDEASCRVDCALPDCS